MAHFAAFTNEIYSIVIVVYFVVDLMVLVRHGGILCSDRLIRLTNIFLSRQLPL